jgi:hypothetical protein
MRAVTVCQPYATLIMSGDKLVENRTWSTKYRGRFFVHAGKSRAYLCTKNVDGVDYCTLTQRPVKDLPFGFVLGITTLLDCLHIDEVRAGKHDRAYPWLRAHHHTQGPWCWVLGDRPVLRPDPVPFKGAQAWFDINPLSLEDIARRAQLARV